jgi:uncharacterized integral membrane protein (TIGR00697 family)
VGGDFKADRRTQLFICLTGVFITALLVGDLIGGKLQVVQVLGYEFVISVGMIPFPITFLLTDLLNEFYGKKAMRFVTLLGLGMVGFTFLVVLAAVSLPWPELTRAPGWKGVTEGSFDAVFASSQRIMLASMVAYLVAQLVDISIFHALKRRTQSRFLWLRATGSTTVSQLVDTICIQTLAWWGLLPPGKIGSLVVSSYLVKLVVAVGLTPFIYAGHALLEKRFDLRPVSVERA